MLTASLLFLLSIPLSFLSSLLFHICSPLFLPPPLSPLPTSLFSLIPLFLHSQPSITCRLCPAQIVLESRFKKQVLVGFGQVSEARDLLPSP